MGARDELGDDRIGTGLGRYARVATDQDDAIAVDAGDGAPDVRAAEIEAEVQSAQAG